jgi:outer membrane protein W
MRSVFLVLVASIGAITSSSASAADDLRGGFTTFMHFGTSYVKQADEATLFSNGVEVPGAAFTTEGDLTVSAEVGILLRKGIAIAVSGTVPTTISNIAGGTLAGLGNLGDESVGYYSLTGQYHFNLRGAIQPYVGAGLGYMHVFATADGVVTDLDVASAWGGVLQIGLDAWFDDRIGVFADVKRYWIDTSASGTLGPNTITADATVNPWVFTTGLGIRF